MLNQLLGHTRHIRWFPHKYVTVGLKEADDCAFLFVIHVTSIQSNLG
jgi:hypothetical protein